VRLAGHVCGLRTMRLHFVHLHCRALASLAPDVWGVSVAGMIPVALIPAYHLLQRETITFWVSPQRGYILDTSSRSHQRNTSVIEACSWRPAYPRPPRHGVSPGPDSASACMQGLHCAVLQESCSRTSVYARTIDIWTH
jgi:hypothetical protein